MTNEREKIHKQLSEVSQFLSPSSPIKSIQFLEGRIDEFEKIDEILSFGGRSVFITGDRGVGKTSLAQTAAIFHTYTSYEYVYSACDPEPFGTFGKIAKDMLIKLAQLVSKHQEDNIETKSGMSLLLSINPSIKFTKEWSDSRSAHEICEPDGASDVIRYLKGFGEILKQPLCVVLDELENLTGEECRANLAHLMKQLGDQEIPFKFIFAGIGETPSNLIGIHESTSRYYGAVQLEPLKAQAIIDIINKPIKHFKLSIPKPQLYRIYTISCGFPHFPHLIGAKLISYMIKESMLKSDSKSFLVALNKSVEDSQPSLIKKYNKSIEKNQEKIKTILWAFADNRDIDQNGKGVFDTYRKLKTKYSNKTYDLTKNQIVATLNQLTKETYGNVLTRSYDGRAYYKFSDPLMRGYVRLRAESEGIELASDEVYNV